MNMHIMTKIRIKGQILNFDIGFFINIYLSNRKICPLFREIRPSGMRGGLAETLAMVELGTQCTN